MDVLEDHGSLREDRSLRSRERIAPFTPERPKARGNAAIARRLDMVHNGTSANCSLCYRRATPRSRRWFPGIADGISESKVVKCTNMMSNTGTTVKIHPSHLYRFQLTWFAPFETLEQQAG